MKSLNNISEIKISCTDENDIPHTIVINDFENAKDFIINTYSNQTRDFKYVNGTYTCVDNLFSNCKLDISLICDGYNIRDIKEDI